MKKFTANEIAESSARYLVDDLGLSEQDLLRAVLSLIDFGDDATRLQREASKAIKYAIRELDEEDRVKSKQVASHLPPR